MRLYKSNSLFCTGVPVTAHLWTILQSLQYLHSTSRVASGDCQLTFLQASHSNGHGCLGVTYLVSLVQNDPVPVDLEQCGRGGNTALANPWLFPLIHHNESEQWLPQ